MPPLGVVPSTGLTNAGATVVPDTRFHRPENPVLRPLPFPPTLVTTDPGTVPTALRFPERAWHSWGLAVCVLSALLPCVSLQCHCVFTGAAFHGPSSSSAFSLDGGVHRGITCLVWGSPDEECACRQNLADGT